MRQHSQICVLRRNCPQAADLNPAEEVAPPISCLLVTFLKSHSAHTQINPALQEDEELEAEMGVVLDSSTPQHPLERALALLEKHDGASAAKLLEAHIGAGTHRRRQLSAGQQQQQLQQQQLQQREAEQAAAALGLTQQEQQQDADADAASGLPVGESTVAAAADEAVNEAAADCADS